MKYQAIDSEYIREMKERDEFLRQKGYMLKGVKYGYFVAIIIIILSAFFSGNLVLAQTNDINYTFGGNELYNSTGQTFSNLTNVRNQTLYTEIYNGTYSLTSETGDIGTDIEFIDIYNAGAGTSAEVVANIDGHNEVLKIEDKNNPNTIEVFNVFDSAQNSGTIEFWYRVEDATPTNYLLLYSGANIVIYLQIVSELFKYHDGALKSTGITCLDLTWYHIRIDYECGAGVYLGLGADTFYLTINGLQLGAYNCFSNQASADRFRIATHTTSIVDVWLDGIGFSWDTNYDINDNLIPYSITNDSIQEIDVYSFSYTEGGVYTEAEWTIPFWDEVYGTDDSHGYERTLDSCALVYSDDTFDVGFYKDDFTLTDGMIDITFHLEVNRLDVIGGVFYINVYSDDTTLKTRLRFLITGVEPNLVGTLSYYDGASYNDITILGERDGGKNFTLTINPSNLIVFKDDSGILEIYDGIDYDLGLSEIEFIGQAGANGDDVSFGRAIRMDFDYVGIYHNGESLSTDFMSISAETGINWDSNEYHLFTTNITGVCSITANNFILYPSYNYSTEQIYNVYDLFTGGNEVEGWISLRNVSFHFVSNSIFSIENISITGVSLGDGTTDYFGTLTYSGVNINESYYYISDNSLYFTMTTNDSGLEYMEITFDIGNIVASNRSLKYSGLKSASSLVAQFKVNYIDSTYNPFTLEPDYKNLVVLLPRTKTIGSFGLLISDNNNDVNDTITGFIGSFDLLYVPLITTDFISISFFDALPIVVLVVVIPIALYIGFGKKKELLIPSIIAMSIFGTAVGLIPLWLTFVIGFGCVSALIIQSRS